MRPRTAARCLGVVLLLALPRIGAVARDVRTWSRRNTVLELSLASLTLVDTMQTIHFVGEGYRESNPLLGERPRVGALLAYDVAAIGLHAVVAWALPEPYRSTWQLVWVGAEAWTVGSNVLTHRGFHVTLVWNW